MDYLALAIGVYLAIGLFVCLDERRLSWEDAVAVLIWPAVLGHRIAKWRRRTKHRCSDAEWYERLR
jgi:hypothetical protein